MKLLGMILLIAVMQVSARGYSQTVSLSFNNAPLKEVLKEIERQAGVHFIYSKTAMEKALPVTISLIKQDLKLALEKCFQQQPLSWVIENEFVILQLRPGSAVSKNAQSVSGRVVNDRLEPLAGISVTIKGLENGTITDAKGQFELADVPEDATLIFTGAEYNSAELRLTGKINIRVVLTQRVGDLDETIVVGYGTTTRRLGLGSVSKITGAEIERQPVSNPLAALQGRVPGLVINSTSGVPGSSFTVQIRGQNSLNPLPGTTNPIDQPLFVIDGVPFAPQNNNINLLQSISSGATTLNNNPYGGNSPFALINPADIESIEVLRDANETAIYGSRGANGVILITTKKGAKGEARFKISAATGISHVTNSMKMMDTDAYLVMRREAFLNDGIIPSANALPSDPEYAPDLTIFNAGKNRDWVDYFLGGPAKSYDVNTQLDGGSENTHYLLGMGYHRDTYIFPGDFANDRISFNASIQQTSSNKKFKLNWSANYGYSQNNNSGSPSFFEAIILPPNQPEFVDSSGNLVWDYNGVQFLTNPLSYLKQTYEAKTDNLLSNLQLEYNFLKGFTASISVGYNELIGKEVSKYPSSASSPYLNQLAQANFGTNSFHTWIIEPKLQYIYAYKKFALNVITGGTYQRNSNSTLQLSGSNYANEALLGSISAAGDVSASDNNLEYRYLGLYGRATMDWDKKYLLQVSGRRDGSSRFGPGKQFGNFGSGAVGWIFSEEKMFRNAKNWMNFGKIRMSYGSTGNDAVGDYQYLSRWANSYTSFPGGVTGYVPQNLANAQFAWSVTRKFEAALEFGLLKNRIISSIAWYRNRSSNQLVLYPLPQISGGFEGITANLPALVQNAGIEFSFSLKAIDSRDFKWTVNANLSVPRNKLISFPDFDVSPYFYTYVLGESVNVFNKYLFGGVNPSTGLYEFVTKTGLSSTPERQKDFHVIGNGDPRFFGGLGNSLSFKNLQLDIFLEFKKQYGPNYLQQLNSAGPPGRLGNLPDEFLDRWSHPGDISAIQRLTTQYYSTAAGLSSMEFTYSDGAYSDASYLRFKTISLSYLFTAKSLKNLKDANCRAYINAQNVLTITKYKGHDPETMSFFSLPPLRNIAAGLQFNF